MMAEAMPEYVMRVTCVLTVGVFCCGVLLPACGDDEQPCEEGTYEASGPRCCAGGCGNSTTDWRPRLCKNGQWICAGGSRSTIEYACASPHYACQNLLYCSDVGLGKSEPDPAPELCCNPDPTGQQCCEKGCTHAKVKHRECASGTLWTCPAGTVPISRCKDYATACNNVLDAYRKNSYKLPQ